MYVRANKSGFPGAGVLNGSKYSDGLHCFDQSTGHFPGFREP